ncbi:hypothetical protein BD560DRAFT_392140 [Blakeslea trispora]|nr:hypothetical protein BD560DRAFT_392140 [Blakeslea trispora]
MWKHRESHLVDIYKTNPQGERKSTMQTSDAKPIYPGCEFDVFANKAQSREDATPYVDTLPPKKKSVTNTMPPPPPINTIKKTNVNHVFIQPTASIHTPIATMFLEKQNEEDAVDLEYA